MYKTNLTLTPPTVSKILKIECQTLPFKQEETVGKQTNLPISIAQVSLSDWPLLKNENLIFVKYLLYLFRFVKFYNHDIKE